MKKRLINLVAIGLLAILCIAFFCACDKDDFDNKYNAVLFESVLKNLNADYLAEHSTKGTPIDGMYPDSDTRPDTKTAIIADEQTFTSAFNDFSEDIDFEKQIIILYFYTGNPIKSSGGTRFFECKFKEIVQSDNCLNIKIEIRSLAKDKAPRLAGGATMLGY